MDNDKSAFLEKYKDCAEVWALEIIWQAKQSNATELAILGDKVNDLLPLKDLVNLRVLDVHSTQVSNLMPLKDLVNLQELYVYMTQVSDLLPLKDLVNLQKLNVSYTQVSDLLPLKDLVNLRQLNVNSTQVSDLLPLKDLVNLQKLDVHNTQVSDLLPLKDLVNLQQLNVYNTQLSDLMPLKDLVNLRVLDVHSTQVSNLMPLKDLIEKGIKVEWKRASLLTVLHFNNGGKVNGIYIEDCPLSNPHIEIAKQGNAAILRYWAEQERSGLKQLNEARLLIVGQGGAGKTTLKEKLKNPHAAMPEPDMMTRGIVIEPLVFKNTEGRFYAANLGFWWSKYPALCPPVFYVRLCRVCLALE